MLKIKRRDFCSRRQYFIFVYKHSVKNRKLYLRKETCYGTGNFYIDLYFTIFNLVQCMYKQKCVKPRFFNWKITLWWCQCENHAVQLSLMKNRIKNIPSHKAYKKAKKEHKKDFHRLHYLSVKCFIASCRKSYISFRRYHISFRKISYCFSNSFRYVFYVSLLYEMKFFEKGFCYSWRAIQIKY